MPRTALHVLALMLVLVFPGPRLSGWSGGGGLAAQEPALVGYLVDDTNLQPVSEARITLIQGEDRLTGVTTDAVGAFLLPVPGDGEYQVEARRIGYTTTLSQALRIEDGDTLSVEFRILPDAVVLDPITVTARSNRGRVQFDRRQDEWGRGIFLDPADIRAMELEHAAEVLDNQEKIWFNWEWGRGMDGISGRFPNIRTFLGRGCMMYAIDGRAIWEPPRGHPDENVPAWLRWPLNALRPDDVVAVEVYRSTNEAPPELRRHGTSRRPDRIGSCGVTVFWTRFAW